MKLVRCLIVVPVIAWIAWSCGVGRSSTPAQSTGERSELGVRQAPAASVTGEDVTFFGRLVDEHGAPLSGEVTYGVHFSHSEMWSEIGGRLVLDGDGRFRFSCLPRQHTRGRAWFEARPVNGEPPTRRTERTLECDFASGVHDLGEFELTPIVVLASGVVVDERGDPVGGTNIWMSSVAGDEFGPWLHALESTDDRGRFAFHGPRGAGLLRLAVERAGGNDHRLVLVDSESLDLRIVVPRSGAVMGRVRVDEHLPFGDLVVRVFRSDLEHEERRCQHVPMPTEEPQSAEYSIGGLPPGRVSVHFLARNGPLLARFDDVAVVAGESSSDPRLVDVDLRGAVKALRVTAHDENGTPVEFARVRARGTAAERPWLDSKTEAGRTAVRAKCLPIDVVVGAPGRRTQRFDSASRDIAAVLAPGLAVEFVFDAEARAALGADVKLIASYEQGTVTTPDDAVWWPEIAAIDGDGSARVVLCEPGRFRVELRAVRGQNEEFAMEHFACTPASVEVRDSQDVQRFAITLGGAAREALAAFRSGKQTP